MTGQGQISREIHLAARPIGWPTADAFRVVEVKVPEPAPGQVVIRNRYMSVDPYMRGRMNDVKSYVPPFAVGKVLDGGAVGEVVASADDKLHVGDVVLHGLASTPWRTRSGSGRSTRPWGPASPRTSGPWA